MDTLWFGVLNILKKTGYFCIKHLVSWTKNCNLFIEYKLYLTFSSFLWKWDGLVYFYFLLWILVLCICNKQNSLWCKMPSAIAKQLYILCSREIILGPWYIVRFSSLSCVFFCHPKSLRISNASPSLLMQTFITENIIENNSTSSCDRFLVLLNSF